MIDRYSRKELKAIWSEENKYKIWLDIEVAAAEAMEKYKIIPKGVSKKVIKKAKINPKRILEIEKKVKHDVIAFLTSITEKVGKEARYLHKGMTSSDVLDTCFNFQLKKSGEILLNDINQLLVSIRRQAIKHKYTLCIGRSHGIHAESEFDFFVWDFEKTFAAYDAGIVDEDVDRTNFFEDFFGNAVDFFPIGNVTNIAMAFMCSGTVKLVQNSGKRTFIDVPDDKLGTLTGHF